MSETELEEQAATNDSNVEAPTGKNARRIRSTISFPYGSLADAERVAEALHRRGDRGTIDELAGEMAQTVTSGSFRTRVATARIFGVIEVQRGQVSLSRLGHRLIDPTQAPQARVDAFLHVPLFKRIHEAYRGRLLPSASGLEAEMTRLGVSSKQTDRARQAFQSSAERAGFFGNGKDRLVAPALSGDQTPLGEKHPLPELLGEDLGMPRMMIDMWRHLLENSETMTPEQIKAYLDGARTIWSSLPH